MNVVRTYEPEQDSSALKDAYAQWRQELAQLIG
jgi:hypothetical protein